MTLKLNTIVNQAPKYPFCDIWMKWFEKMAARKLWEEEEAKRRSTELLQKLIDNQKSFTLHRE